MNYETIKIEKVEKSCPTCEDYAEKHSTNPPKIAVMACEGACAKGEIARIAANLVAHKRADKVIAIEGCFISCSSRMMKGVLPGLIPVIVPADMLYDTENDAFGIDEFPEEELKGYAQEVAEIVVREHINSGK